MEGLIFGILRYFPAPTSICLFPGACSVFFLYPVSCCCCCFLADTPFSFGQFFRKRTLDKLQY